MDGPVIHEGKTYVVGIQHRLALRSSHHQSIPAHENMVTN